jgi:hypothetical protein
MLRGSREHQGEQHAERRTAAHVSRLRPHGHFRSNPLSLNALCCSWSLPKRGAKGAFATQLVRNRAGSSSSEMLRFRLRAVRLRGADLAPLPWQETSTGEPTAKGRPADHGEGICCAMQVARGSSVWIVGIRGPR